MTTKYYYLDIKSHQKKAILFQSSPLKYFALSIFSPTKVQCLQRGRCCLWPSNLLRKKEVTIRFLACKPPCVLCHEVSRWLKDWDTIRTVVAHMKHRARICSQGNQHSLAVLVSLRAKCPSSFPAMLITMTAKYTLIQQETLTTTSETNVCLLLLFCTNLSIDRLSRNFMALQIIIKK